MFYGKLIGGLIGLLVGGLIGLIIGVFVGHSFDRGLSRTLQFGSRDNLERIKTSFFETTFLLSGYLAKADGRVSQQEIDHTEAVFAQMGLDADQRRRAIELFRQGAAGDFQPEPVIAQFLRACGPQRRLQQTLLLFLISLALADQTLDAAEHAVLQRIASWLGMGAAQLEQLLRMARAQAHFHQHGGGGAAPAGTSLEDAYAALGVEAGVGDRELKHAYRKLMSEHHPDKLIARGVPQEMVKLATERSQEIQAAYEMIRRHRGTGKRP
ncbi:MAG: co-chaperone DjlA [Halioglobus sp.]|nr:co-chaperone DjlA [Halioglobus sp.]